METFQSQGMLLVICYKPKILEKEPTDVSARKGQKQSLRKSNFNIILKKIVTEADHALVVQKQDN